MAGITADSFRFRESPATWGEPHDLLLQGPAPAPGKLGSCEASPSLGRKNKGWGRRGREEENQEERRADGRAGKGAALGTKAGEPAVRWEDRQGRPRGRAWGLGPEATFCNPSDPDWWYDLSKMPCALGLSSPTCQRGKG